MLKKFLFGASAAAVAVATVPMFAAFEAHVINVTARIENALAVSTKPISFGTVFPEEKLDKLVTVGLSGSFLEEPRVDDVNYILRQKPKCGITTQNGTVLDESSTKSGEPALGTNDVPFIDCGQPPRTPDPTKGEVWGPLPLLCPYLSKHPIRSSEDPSGNDGSLNAFHEIGHWVGHQWVWNDVPGRLAKSENDRVDLWNLDLVVPCFKGSCAQDDVVPAGYEADPLDEHKIFGCDLWIEVTGVSRVGEGQVVLRTSDDFTLGGTTFAPPIVSTITASTTGYYSVRTVSSSSVSIPTVRWKVTVDGPAALSLGDVHVDEVGWQDPDEVNIATFHYKMSEVGGNLVATGSCAAAGVHDDTCATDDFDVDPTDDFTNVDSVYFGGSAPLGTYVIKRQLVDTESGLPVSNEATVAVVELVP